MMKVFGGFWARPRMPGREGRRVAGLKHASGDCVALRSREPALDRDAPRIRVLRAAPKRLRFMIVVHCEP